MNRSRKDITMMVVMTALFVFAIFNFVFKPQRSELSTARSDLQTVEQKISDAALKLQVPLPTTTTSPADGPAAAPAIPEDPALTQLLRQLQAVAESSGVTYSVITPTPLAANPNGPGGSMAITIAATGSHDGIQAYVKALRDLDRLLVIEQISITTPPAVADQPQGLDQLQLSVRAFTLRGPVSAVAPTTTSKP
jgi:Tfp pilus assembly protein PilO